MQVWLQEFAWTEEDKAQDLQTRDSGNDRLSSKDAERLHKQPMFCMETAINMFYWSVLVYDHEEVRGGLLGCMSLSATTPASTLQCLRRCCQVLIL